ARHPGRLLRPGGHQQLPHLRRARRRGRVPRRRGRLRAVHRPAVRAGRPPGAGLSWVSAAARLDAATPSRREWVRTPTPSGRALMTYDYVIAGAGSAGCVLAARLTEDPNVSVCLIEAGPPDAADELHLPAGVLAVATSKYDWSFISDPEPGMAGRQRYLPRGRTLGGSSSVNAMVYIRGNRADYDEWAA